MNALGASLDGEVMGYMGGGSSASGPYGVDDEVGANPMMCECSRIGTRGDCGSTWQGMLKGGASARGPSSWGRSWLWWLSVMLDTEERVGLLHSCLDWGWWC